MPHPAHYRGESGALHSRDVVYAQERLTLVRRGVEEDEQSGVRGQGWLALVLP